MLVFLDTEFTDFTNCDLISIGLVAMDKAFYGENQDFIRSYSSEWVQENIYPLLNFNKFGYKRAALAAAVWEWFDQFDEPVDVVVDYDKDFGLLSELFGYNAHPKIRGQVNVYDLLRREASWESPGKIKTKFDMLFHDFLRTNNKEQHHALYDAMGNMHAYKLIKNAFFAGTFDLL